MPSRRFELRRLLIGRPSRRDEHQGFSPVQAVSARPRPEATAVLRGTRSATILLSVIGDVADFADEAKLASYFGIVPVV
ncbi:MAG: transposase, partial [Pyrinomonadaceae bacterium]